METLKLNKETAIKLYPDAAPEFKKMLEETFGEKALKRKITDRVKTFEDACWELGINPNVIIVTGIAANLKSDTKSIEAYSKLIIITRALNEGWEPNWDDSDEYKYYLWFRMDSDSGCCFSYRIYDCEFTSTACSRLCFRSRELAEYAAKQFISLYRDFMTL